MTLRTLIVLIGVSVWIGPGLSDELAAPIRIEANGQPIDTEIGHAAPCVADFDGDGVQDLLVGQFKGGVLWVYHNTGTNADPKLAAGVKFKEGKEGGCVPYG